MTSTEPQERKIKPKSTVDIAKFHELYGQF